MYNVLIVDDEPLVCEGIRDFLTRSDLDLSNIQIALNGFEALDYIRSERPHVVLTDIQMVGMSGVELMEAVFLEHPSIPFIVISAHDEFEYAQKCVRFGAKDYIVKPVAPSQLTAAVRKVLKEQHPFYTEQTIKQKFSLDGGMLSPKNYILSEIFSAPWMDTRDVEQVFESVGFELLGSYYSLFVAKVDFGSDKNFKDCNLLKYGCINVIEETISNWNGLVFSLGGNRIAGLMQWADEAAIANTAVSELNMIGKLLHYNIKTYLNLETTVGLSVIRKGIGSIGELYRQAEEVMKWRNLHLDYAVYYAGDFNNDASSTLTQLQQKIDEAADLWRKDLGDSEASREVEQILCSIGPLLDDNDFYFSFVSLASSRFYSLLLEFKEEIGEHIRPYDPRFCNEYMAPVEGRKDAINGYFLSALKLLKECNDNKDRSLIQHALAYIKKFYRNKGLSLQEIASEIHLSPNYLSYLFKRNMGINLWDFVIKLRMEEAKRLLLTTDKKRYEISDEIGYESPEHFSRMFRKYFGVSPNEIRK